MLWHFTFDVVDIGVEGGRSAETKSASAVVSNSNSTWKFVDAGRGEEPCSRTDVWNTNLRPTTVLFVTKHKILDNSGHSTIWNLCPWDQQHHDALRFIRNTCVLSMKAMLTPGLGNIQHDVELSLDILWKIWEEPFLSLKPCCWMSHCLSLPSFTSEHNVHARAHHGIPKTFYIFWQSPAFVWKRFTLGILGNRPCFSTPWFYPLSNVKDAVRIIYPGWGLPSSLPFCHTLQPYLPDHIMCGMVPEWIYTGISPLYFHLSTCECSPLNLNSFNQMAEGCVTNGPAKLVALILVFIYKTA